MVWNEVILAVTIFVHLFFIIALLKKDNSIMTFGWPLGLMIIGVVSYLNFPSDEIGLQVLLIVTLVWGVRLFIRTLIRNLKRGYEDFRYRELRENTNSGFVLRSYLQFFVVQGIFMLIVGIPFVYANRESYETNFVLLYIGTILFTLGWFIETIADIQLDRFKAKHEAEEVLRTGLWKYTRHPNYLGEILIWWGIGLISFHISTWWVLVSPLVVTLLLRYVSGVPLLEARYEKNKDYQQYQAETPAIFPLS